MNKIAALFATVLVAGCSTVSAPDVSVLNSSSPHAMNTPHVTMVTSLGTIKMELFADKTPITTENFVKLAKSGFYDGVLFHRVIPNFMVQAGDPLTKDDDPYNDGTGGPGYTITDEIVPGLSNVRGSIAMANTGRKNSGGSQFFINVVDNSGHLDGGYTVFGKVTEGMDVVDEIVHVPTNHSDPRLKDRPMGNVKILSVTVENN